MVERVLSGSHVLIAEDEWLVAAAIQEALVDAGAIVIGPVGRVADALDLIAREERIDGAVLDLNLRSEMVFPVADLLVQRGVPFVFTTGYDLSNIPKRFERVVRCEKPTSPSEVVMAMSGLIRT